MAHNCVDWNAQPPARKTPLLVLTHGDEDVYSIVPEDLEALHEIARNEFDLGNVDVHILSPCASFCHGKPARITKDVWDHIRPYIGCATVQVARPRAEEQPQDVAPEAPEEEQRVGAKRKLPSDADENDQQVLTDGDSDHGNDQRTSATEDDEDQSDVAPARRRTRRRLASEDEARGEAQEANEPQPLTASQTAGKQERVHTPSGSQTAEPPHQPDVPIKQEKLGGGNTTQSTPTEAQADTDVQTQVDVGEAQKLMIRVAHRPSDQEAKFMTKSTTSVGKVLAGACKSFNLDHSLATLYLIVTVEDEEGNMESLFPCDKNDTIARAGAECSMESRFLLKITGEA